MAIEFPPSWTVYWYGDAKFLCDLDEGKYNFSPREDYKWKNDFVHCREEWLRWLLVANTEGTDVIFDFLALFAILLYKPYLSSSDYPLEGHDAAEMISSASHRRFLKAMFNYYYIFVGLFIMIIAAALNYAGSSDFISLGYMLFSLYFLVYGYGINMDPKRHYRWLQISQYNVIIIFIQVIFQVS